MSFGEQIITPIEPILHHPGIAENIQVFVKRDDLIHPIVAGNKWRKLSTLIESRENDPWKGLITFGGAFSNHIHAVAGAGQYFGFPTAAFIRGEFIDTQNPTLDYATKCGMTLIPVPKSVYDSGPNAAGIEVILEQYMDWKIVPEGGSMPSATLSCQKLGHEIIDKLQDLNIYDNIYVAVSAGTGCTAAGLSAGLAGTNIKLLVFPVDKKGVDIARIHTHWKEAGIQHDVDPIFIDDYTCGGFATFSRDVYAFSRQFHADSTVLLDPIYTSKMFFGLFDLIRKKFFPEGSTIIGVHTGGLQGWKGFETRYVKKIAHINEIQHP